MSAPVLWIFIPLILGALAFFPRNQKLLALVAAISCALLALTALLLPVDTAITFRSLSFKLVPTFEVLGRRLTLVNADRPWLVLLLGGASMWLAGTASIGIARRLVPFGLIVTGLLIAALAVEPFLYAALIFETAVLFSIPLLTPPGRQPGHGVMRFLIYQTIAMPFILFSGWLLAGVEANPGDVALVTRAASLLGMGFALLLAVFPFYAWIPLLAEESHPYVAGFVLWVFPTVSMFFGLGFLDRYAWLRESGGLSSILTTVGLLMIFLSGLFSLFQRNLSRMMGYAVLAETGFSLVAMALGGNRGLNSFLLLCIPRLLGLVIWSFGLSKLREQAQSLSLDDLKGAGYAWSFSSAAVVLAGLSLAGLPLLASFPARLAIWEGLARQSVAAAAWALAGSLGLAITAMRVLAVLVNAPEGSTWGSRESTMQRILIISGGVMLLLLGIVPSLASILWTTLPALFTHLGQ